MFKTNERRLEPCLPALGGQGSRHVLLPDVLPRQPTRVQPPSGPPPYLLPPVLSAQSRQTHPKYSTHRQRISFQAQAGDWWSRFWFPLQPPTPAPGPESAQLLPPLCNPRPSQNHRWPSNSGTSERQLPGSRKPAYNLSRPVAYTDFQQNLKHYTSSLLRPAPRPSPPAPIILRSRQLGSFRT